jgi:beta-lactamase class A
MKKLSFATLLLLVLFVNARAQSNQTPFSTDKFVPIVQTKDVTLERKLKKIVAASPQWQKLVNNKKMCVGIVDFGGGDNPRFASVNGDHMMYAASLPKIAILLAVMDAIDKGEVVKTPEVDRMMNDMIRISHNGSSTALIDLVGYEKIAEVLQNKKYNLYDENKGGGLWVGKRYAAGGRRYPEPIKGLSHAATVNQVLRFYYMLAYGKLINCERSGEMLDYLYDPHLHHKFVFSLDRIAPNANVYRKSGTWRNFHADSVMVLGDKWRSYVLVALIEDPGGEQIMRDLATKVDKMLYNQGISAAY